MVAQLFEAGQTGLALGLTALGVGTRPLQFFLHGLGAGIFGALLGRQTGFFLLQPAGVVAFVGNAGAPVEFQNPFGSVVQEVAVVGDGHHSPRKTLQEQLEPVHAFSIQVVGRFVQQQHVRARQQQTAQGHAALFAARQLADDGVPRGQAQRVGSDLELMLRSITSGRNDGFELGLLGGQGVKVCVLFGVGGVHLFQAGLRGLDFAHAAFHGFTHGLLGVHHRFLGQITDFQARHGDGFAFDLFVDAGHDFEQSGLARSVGAQHADLGTWEERQRNVFEDVTLRRHDLANPVHRKYVLSHV